ncbi:KamA family radical SAM protein [Streptomyces sp. NBC_01803]|uniref:KamA family radical SAM protein n=1 Tax=Streptomyces sp. NBC_01803 TaxID=2975946 RepID=UPI002DDAF754|nr:lysine 2,3-aminomutase [Streptomyces sp. NBC_01803]WSA43089.1 lysine 2,3-aminomutase [Streptomyces sp. NBC_01803]
MQTTARGGSRFRALGPRQLDEIVRRYPLGGEERETVRLFSRVLPFRVNEYVLTELIDWSRVPDDPAFQLVFPQPGMLAGEDVDLLRRLDGRPDGDREVVAAVAGIRARLNPHPGGQLDLNVPRRDGAAVPGLQHKYRETVLYFPGHGQTCHAYCTYCFRWAQFIGAPDLRFAAPGPEDLIRHLREHPEVTDVLVTGGDPMVMSSERLRAHLEPLLRVDRVRTIRIGTKSPAYWPQRFTTDPDADDALRLFEQVVASGRTLAVMAHFSHERELATPLARRSLARVRATGASVYCQAPLMAHVNDSADAWSALWRAELAAGCVPYYMFVARDTGPYRYFQVSLDRAAGIFRDAYSRLPGLARTVRGPVMSASVGKAVVDGVEELPEGRFFRLRLLQARDPGLVARPFRARWSPTAAWLDDLEPDPATDADLLAALSGAAPAATGARP